jgi:hypothetical protein
VIFYIQTPQEGHSYITFKKKLPKHFSSGIFLHTSGEPFLHNLLEGIFLHNLQEEHSCTSFMRDITPAPPS